jgi:S1-C subfamily serine protease
MTDSAVQEKVDQPEKTLPSRPRRGHSHRGRLLGTVGVLLLAVGVLIGMVVSSPTTTSGPAEPITSTVQSNIAAVAALVSPAVVQLESETGLGSGVIYDTEGLILTAAHVVADVDTVKVRLADGRLLDGKVVGRHQPTDIAVIAIPGDSFPAASLAYGSTAQVGETAIALGSPFGLNQTVTAGIVSATGRTVNGVPMVQTDAAINPGNSGGPLINGAGKVIGINDIIFTEGGGNDGIGFAVSIDVAIVVADQLVAGDGVQLASLGVGTIPDTSGQGGAIVQSVIDGSAADAAGFIVGDRIVAVDGQTVADPSALFTAIVTHRPGAEATISYSRDSSLMTTVVKLLGISP